MIKPFACALFLVFATPNSYASGKQLTTILQKFPILQTLAATTIITACSISSGCMPKAVDSWLRGTRSTQAQAQRTAIGISEAANDQHVFGYSDSYGYFVGEIVATSEQYHTVKLYKDGNNKQIPKQAVEATLIVDHPDIGLFHKLPTDLVGALHLRGEVIGVYRYLEYKDALLYAYHVQESIDLSGQIQPHDDSIIYRNMRVDD